MVPTVPMARRDLPPRPSPLSPPLNPHLANPNDPASPFRKGRLQKFADRLSLVEHPERLASDAAVFLKRVQPHQGIERRGQILRRNRPLVRRRAETVGAA